MHPYSEGYNVEAQKQQKGRKRSLCIDVDEANDAVNPNPENLEMIVQPENCRTEDADDPSSRENEKPAEGEPVKLNKPNFVKKPDSLSKIPEGGWNQDGLEVQPHGSKKRDKRSIHKAATAQQKKNKTRKDRHSI
ncbi:MAG: hypothetical protein M1821_007456 [Bathelium mastoideum]|nr:MAG: hypothetical protein M1821_007456 [Bathelium mastoideum]KAI9694958.1 MAG: hypothetical protein M1822_000575 [Bathelium mastoideum]